MLALPFSIVPSILWLLFFVHQDKHREKMKDVVKVFFWGIIIALPVVLVEVGFQEYVFAPFAALIFSELAYSFIGISFVEEFAKYLVVRFRAMPYKFFDEPQDAMVYMIASALGFSAIENFVYALNFAGSASEVLQISIFRGVSATFLHVVASGTLGYFLALALETPKERRKFFWVGLALATLLHGVYNNFLMDLGHKILNTQDTGGLFGALTIATLLIISGIIIIIGINKLTRIRFSTQSNTTTQNYEQK
ncbi:MAG: hypothetical protein A3H51_02295 [Candidatus Spechtbacteria bacterium RIFCSPLOWO2_02_FULL_38_8]|uniref:Protease PrsW n=1 Tax=Candidatus Spechtbacteria bacterium RIFCSPLOWO2_02_FULL_38_8 TaxID=1802164 RepID=A0A1G2HKP9_9BACT|nr:MAG: hypothetical protein A3H51_02295 [Candidatus Spechtbacteria bacterium RIFCSPLOWO2_02_FULL_38_8]